MAATPQGYYDFNGIEDVVSGSFSLTHGVTPSICTINVAPNKKTLKKPKVGTLTLKYSGKDQTFPDCCVADVDFEIAEEGRELWQITIADTRWRWRFAFISGEYNVRTIDQQIKDEPKVKLRTKKTARELAELLTNKLKLKNPNLKNFPDDAFPEVKWDYSRVDQALADLCELYGLRVCLNAGNVVTFPKQGEGAALPESDDATDASATFEVIKKPPEIRWAGGPDMWQFDFELEPVARELNGDYVELDKVSYKPRGSGWRAIDIPNFNSITDRKARQFAQESVYRAYRIKVPFRLPNVKDEVKFLWRILPLHSTQLDKARVDNVLQELPPWVYGVFFDGNSKLTDNEEFQARQRLGDVQAYPNGIWKRGFELDVERGVVVMSEPVYRVQQWGGQTPGVAMIPAWLVLRVAVSLRDQDNGAWIHREEPRRIAAKNVDTDPLISVNPEISFKTTQSWQGGKPKVSDNEKEWKEAAAHYLDAMEQQLEDSEPSAVSYAGFKELKLDGAIQQIAWTVSDRGEARTRAARNTERDTIAVSFKERRLREKLNQALAALAQNNRGPLGAWTNRQ